MIKLFLIDVFVGCVFAIIFYVTGVVYDLSRHYFSTGTAVSTI
jgi:hypothetical protein